MFTLKFYRSSGGYELHQAHTVEIRPYSEGRAVGSSDDPEYEVTFEDPTGNCVEQKLIGADRLEHYDRLIVENMNGKTTEIVYGS